MKSKKLKDNKKKKKAKQNKLVIVEKDWDILFI